MAIVPTIRCRDMARSLAFYTGILDFEPVGGDGRSEDPRFVALVRAGDRLFLSSHPGDGAFGQAIVVETDDVDAAFRLLCRRGLRPPDRPEDPVHRSPVDQTWGTREFYVDDPDGNTLRFTQMARGGGSDEPAMRIVRLDHVQLAMPKGGENRAREFYWGLLGIPEVPKPAALEGRGGAWFESGDLKVHLGVDPEFRAARKAHPAFVVRELPEVVARLRSAGIEVAGDDSVPGGRVFIADPFGNRLELVPSED